MVALLILSKGTLSYECEMLIGHKITAMVGNEQFMGEANLCRIAD